MHHHDDLGNSLRLSYDELKNRNLKLKKQALERKNMEKVVVEAIKKEPTLKAVIICFADLEGKLHMLDYNAEFFVNGYDHLTFDGSSIRGFTPQSESDLYLRPDWRSFRWLPADVFGSGKSVIFCNVYDQAGKPYESDFRGRLAQLTNELAKKKIVVNMAPEIEGLLFEGENAEQNFNEIDSFRLASKGGYFNTLPQDRLRQFIDRVARAINAMGYENEKDHPEVSPSQFEINFKYTDVLLTCDQILLYKLICRQVAKTMGLTASFLAKPTMNINGNGMHSNMSLSKGGKNIFYDKKGKHNLSKDAWEFASGVLHYGKDLCLLMNSSVNAYRRLDPHYEAPNEIKMSSTDRGAMVRVPLANEKGARIEVRTVAPDANPYLTYFCILQAGLKGMNASSKQKAEFATIHKRAVRKLPGVIQPAIDDFRRSNFMKEVMGAESHRKYLDLKVESSKRCPALLGERVKTGEILYHHEVTNQLLWSKF